MVKALMPSIPDGSWCLHTGNGPLPANLVKKLTCPDGTPAEQAALQIMDAQSMLSFTGGGQVPYKNKACNNLVARTPFALMPRACKLHAYWDATLTELARIPLPDTRSIQSKSSTGVTVII